MLNPDVDSLVPHVPFNRRTFIKAAIGTGFAAAVLPVSAQTIHTDSEGLEAGEIAVRSGGSLVPAFRAPFAPRSCCLHRRAPGPRTPRTISEIPHEYFPA